MHKILNRLLLKFKGIKRDEELATEKERVDIKEHIRFKEQNEWFAAIIRLSDDAIISKDLNGNILSWNHGAEKIFGYTASEILGRHITLLIPANLRNEEAQIIERIKNKELIHHYETQRVKKNGEIIPVSLTVSPIEDSFGNIVGASKILRDITAEKEAEKKLIKSNRLYSFISAINKSIVLIDNEEALLNHACKVAIDIGKFETVWIGFLDHGKINIGYHLGDKEFLEEVAYFSGIDFIAPPLNNSAIGQVLQSGKYAVINDVSTHAHAARLPALTEKYNIHSAILFPVKKFGKVVGIFALHSGARDFFDRIEIETVHEAVEDISFA
ncbi:MAG: PAS domain S-box protein, partial [Panacibacter sp.]